MLTAKETLKWATHRPTPPWRISELITILKSSRPFSLRQAITGIEKAKCVIFVGVRDFALIQSAATFAQLRATWNSSAPSRNTLISYASFLKAHGASLNFLSKDWKTVAIVSSPANLKGIGGSIIVLEADYPDFKTTGEGLVLAGEVAGAVGAEPLAGALILSGAVEIGVGHLLEFFNSEGDQVPQNTSGETVDSSGSSAGGDPSAGGDVLVIPTVYITGSFTGVDPSTIVDAPPIDPVDIPDVPDTSGNGGGVPIEGP